MRTKQRRAAGSNLGIARITNKGLWLPGNASKIASSPDSPALTLTDEIRVEVDFAAENYFKTGNLFSQYLTGVGTYGWGLQQQSSGNIVFLIYSTGTSSLKAVGGPHLTPPTNRQRKRVAFTHRVSDGRWQYFFSDDGVAWTQVGSDFISASQMVTPALPNSSAPIITGNFNNSAISAFRGMIYSVKLYNTCIPGTPVYFADYENAPLNAKSFNESSPNEALVTIYN